MKTKLYEKKWLRNLVALILLLMLCGTAIHRFAVRHDSEIYQAQHVNIREISGRPVNNLVANIKNGRWHLLRESFASPEVYKKFLEEFRAGSTNEFGILGSAPLSFKVSPYVPESKEGYPDCDITVIVSHKKSPGRMTLQVRSAYNEVSKQYFIERVDYSGKITVNVSTNVPEIPQISAPECVETSESGFMYVRPKWRFNESAEINANVVLGDNPNNEGREDIPSDYYNTNAIVQAPFDEFVFRYENPKWTACDAVSPRWLCDELYNRWITETYDPGIMVTQEDVTETGLSGWMFSSIIDAEGVMEVSADGDPVPYPSGFFLDNSLKRLTIMTAENEVVHYGLAESHYHFSDPAALAIAGNFLYVLDRGDADKLVRFRYGLSGSGKIFLEHKGTTNLGQNLQWVSDITGYRGNNNNVLYAYNTSTQSVFRFTMNATTGEVQQGSQTKEYKHFVTSDGEEHPLGGIEKLVVSPRSEGHDILFAIYRYNEVIALSNDLNAASSKMDLNYWYKMPLSSAPAKIGYNLGNNTFMVTDLRDAKLHIFSGSGAYLGSGGKKGMAEGNSELYRPFLVSSNNFANDAIEFIIASNDWGVKRGFKRFFPQADLGKIEVLEKNATDVSNAQNDEVVFRYALTAANDVQSVIIKLNGKLIKTVTGPFYPDINAESFLANGTGEDGLSEEIKIGWNTVEIEMVGDLSENSNANLRYKRNRSLQFYFIPSVFNKTNLVISDSDASDFKHNKTDNAFYIYKNTLVEGPGQLTISNGKMVILPACTLKIAKERILTATNEDFELHCGANIEVNVMTDIPKVFRSSNFNGTFSNYNMISVRGDYTGGQGSGSAPSSVIEAITCNFANYLGKAIHVIEGRASVVNSIFESGVGQSQLSEFATAAAIAVDPGARIDVRGGQFINNDIAIDGNGAELFIGRHTNTYKGVKFESTLFNQNRIALHAFTSYTEIQNCVLKNNDVGAIDLNGVLDISKNSANTFESNKQALIFSNIAGGQSGNNKFINNEVDISYIAPPGSTTPVSFDFTCNYWKQGATAGLPVIDVISNPVYNPSSGLISFAAIPYLEAKNNSYTCTGGKGGRVAQPEEENLLLKQPLEYHQNFTSLVVSLTAETDNYPRIATEIKNHPETFIVGQYPDRSHVAVAFQQSLIKNGLFTYLYREYKPLLQINTSQYKDAFKHLTDGTSPNKDRYVVITLDKLAFAALFRHDRYSVVAPTETLADMSIVAEVFPNPSKGESSLEFTVPVDGVYSIELIRQNGARVRTIENKMECQRYQTYTKAIDLTDLPSGLYIVKVVNASGNIGRSIKIVKH